MPKTIKKKTNVPREARAGDRGQSNNQRAIHNLERRLDTVESRTISSRNVAKTANAFVNQARAATPLPSKPKHNEYLVPHESAYHDWLKGHDDSPSNLLPNFNIEPSEVKQVWRGNYRFQLDVLAGNTKTVVISSAQATSSEWGGVAGGTPKSFATPLYANVRGVGSWAVPGPAQSTSGLPAAAVLVGNQSAIDDVLLETSASSSPVGYVSDVQSQPPCPFECVLDDGDTLRWQLGRIRIMTENVTIGSDRGGQATLIQPRNSVKDLGTNATTDKFMARGIFRVFDDMTVRGAHGQWATLDVRPGLQAFHAATSGTSNSMSHAAAMLALSNANSSATQKVVVYIQLDWELSGTAVRGIGKPHIHCPLAADHAREVSEMMRASNVLPSDQSPKHSIANGVKLANDRALQLATHGPGLSGVKSALDTARAIMSHPLAKKLASSGFSVVKGLVASAAAAA